MIKDDIMLMIDNANITEEEKKALIDYSLAQLKMSKDFYEKISLLKNKKEFSKDIIDIIESLSKEYKNVKGNS